MNCLEIIKFLENQEQKEVVKAIFGYELFTTDEDKLNEIYEFYYNHPMPNFLDYQICEVSQNLEKKILKKNPLSIF
jgi:hypothetical protein